MPNAHAPTAAVPETRQISVAPPMAAAATTDAGISPVAGSAPLARTMRGTPATRAGTVSISALDG